MDLSSLHISQSVRRLFVGCVLIASALVAGCDAAGPGEVEQQYVVESYLVAGERLPTVRLTRTAPVNAPYDYSDVAVRRAEVTVALLDKSGDVEQRYPYVEVSDTTGVYRPRGIAQQVDVRPLATYRLQVRVPETDDVITSTTVVPDTFSVVRIENDPAVYRGGAQVAFTVTPSAYPGRDQAFYVFTTEALDPTEDQLTPLGARLYKEENISLEDLRLNASPVINEASYQTNPGGTVTIRLPWFAVAFYGVNSTTVSALDDNLYDFVRSRGAQQDGAAFSPGSIPNVIEHVDGGTGVFGSLARQRSTVEIVRSEAESQP